MNSRCVAVCLFVCFATLLSFPRSASSQTSDWTFCASEGGVCVFTGTQEVRYGANGCTSTGPCPDGTACTNSVFGDPVVWRGKQCATSRRLSAPGHSARRKAGYAHLRAPKRCATGRTARTSTGRCPTAPPAQTACSAILRWHGKTLPYRGCAHRRLTGPSARGKAGSAHLPAPKRCATVRTAVPLQDFVRRHRLHKQRVRRSLRRARQNNACRATAPPSSDRACSVPSAGLHITRHQAYANGSAILQDIVRGTACTNSVFGDPIAGTAKSCAVRISDWTSARRKARSAHSRAPKRCATGRTARISTGHCPAAPPAQTPCSVILRLA